MVEQVWFWQQMVSPHMAGLAAALAALGRDVVFIAEQTMSNERAEQGWQAPDLGSAALRLARSAEEIRDIVGSARPHSVHICQGLRANGLVGAAQQALASQPVRQWVVMEAVDDHGWQGPLKRLEYQRLLWLYRTRTHGVLATGNGTMDWLLKRGASANAVFPFAYFLSELATDNAPTPPATDECFQFIFVGRLVDLKRVDLLLHALAQLAGSARFSLTLVGAGPEERSLRSLADRVLPGRVEWLGTRKIGEIPALMAQADCLVLPSRYDGWGAVVSEALMAGTSAICSDTVGAAAAVQASGQGGVFPAGNVEKLTDLLRISLANGKRTPAERRDLARWARCLGADAGARYLDDILVHAAGGGERPTPPWLVGMSGRGR